MPPIRYNIRRPIQRLPVPTEAENLAKLMTARDILKYSVDIKKLHDEILVLQEQVNQGIKENETFRNEIVAALKDEVKKMAGFVAQVQKIQKGDKGEPGQSVDEYAVARRVTDNIKLPKDGANADPNIVARIVLNELKSNKNTLESLLGKVQSKGEREGLIETFNKLPRGKRLKTEHIDGLDQTLSAFRHQLGMGYLHGSGLSHEGIYVETPTGAVNGTNVTYTVLHTIRKVITFSINGEIIHPVSYSTSGSTITFTQALDASLSGTSFTVVYV